MLNLGAIIGGVVASRAADRVGAGRVVATPFGVAAIAFVLLAGVTLLGALASPTTGESPISPTPVSSRGGDFLTCERSAR